MNEDFTLTHIRTFLKGVIFLQHGSIISLYVVQTAHYIKSRRMTMNRFLRILFVLAAWSLTSTLLHAGESLYSINVFGFSWHEDSSQRADAHQVNPGIGLRYDLSESWYVEGNMIWKNSVKGKTATVGLGYHTEIAKINGRPFKIGLQVMRMHYEFPTKQNQSGYVPAVTTEYLASKKFAIAVNFFIKPKESVVFGGFNYRF